MYNWFLNLFGWRNWAGSIAQSSPNFSSQAVEFQQTFNTVGEYGIALPIMIVTPIIVAVFYYFVFNKYSRHYLFRLRYWLIFLAVSVILVGVLTRFVVPVAILTNSVFKTAPFGALAGINSLYSVVVFLLISLVFTKTGLRKLTNASCTPF